MSVVPAAWRARSLGEVAEFIRGVTYSKVDASDEPFEGSIPLLRATNIASSLELAEGLVYVPRRNVTREQILRAGDIVMATSSGSAAVVGKSATFDTRWTGTFGAFCGVLRPGPELDPRFLGFFVQHEEVRRVWSAAARGTNINNLKRGTIEATPVPLPPIVEQRRIVAILEEHLSDLDAAHGSLVGALARMAKLAESAIREAVTDSARTDVALADLVSTPLSNGRSVRDRTGGFPVLRLTAMKAGRLDLSERKDGDWAAQQAAPFLVRRGDFMIARGNGSVALVGRGALVDAEPDAVAFPDTMIRARPDHHRVDASWLAYVWNSRLIRDQIERVARTSAGIYKVNQAQLNGILVPLLPLQQQRAAVARLDSISDESRRCEQAVGAAIARGQSLRRAIFAAAFSGRLTGHRSDTDVISELAEEESA